MPRPAKRPNTANAIGAVVGCLILAAACGPLPRPFAHDDDRPSAGLARLVSGAGVTIINPGDGEDPAAAALATALRDLDLPATTATSPREGAYTITRESDDGPWAVLAPDGTALLHLAATVPAEDAARGMVGAIEDHAAQPVIRRLTGGDSTPMPAAPPPAVHIATIDGLDDRRAQLLAGALEEALRRMGVTVDTEAPFFVAGHLAAEDRPGNAVALRITWTVLHDDGTEIGNATQANTIPAAALDRGFAALATAIAPGGAEGILDLLRQAR